MIVVFTSQNIQQPWASSGVCLFKKSCVNGIISAPIPLEILILFQVFFPTITVTLSLVVCCSTFTHGSIILFDAWGQQGLLSYPSVEIKKEQTSLKKIHCINYIAAYGKICVYFRFLCFLVACWSLKAFVPVFSEIEIHLFNKILFSICKTIFCCSKKKKLCWMLLVKNVNMIYNKGKYLL